MFERRSLTWPIVLGVTMIVIIVSLIIGWVLLNIFSALHWTLLVVGSLFLLLVLVGVVMYLALTVKAINLNRRQSNFMDSVTHELKSPIASLKLYLQTLHRHRVSLEEQKNFFRYMLDDVERLDRLINHLLLAAKLEKREAEDAQDDVRVDELLRQCVSEVLARYRAPASAVVCELSPCVVRAARVDLELVFRNLIDNAIKYSGSPTRVEVRCQGKSPNRIAVSIADNGRGIPLKLRRQIFGRFVRLGMELERDKPGVGLGLYLVKSLVARLKGQVRIIDQPVGQGTVFEVQLPGRTADAADTALELDQAGSPLDNTTLSSIPSQPS